MEDLQNSKIVVHADLCSLKELRARQLQMVQGLGKFKGVLDGTFQPVLDVLNDKIAAIESEIERNHKVAD